MSMLYTFYYIILPILIPIGIGTILQRQYKFDLKSFSKLIINYYVPALAFVKIYEAELSIKLVATVFGFLCVQFIIVVIIGNTVSRMMNYAKPLAASFSNSVSLTNNGNVGIPINALVFKQDALAMSIQIIVVVFELIVTFTFGVLNASKTVSGLKASLVQLAKMPVLYAIALAVIFKLSSITIPEPILMPLSQIATGMFAFALVSIGAQMASSKWYQHTLAVLLSSAVRLVISPLCAFGLILLFNIDGIIAQALLIASAIPTSRNSAVLALEYNNEPAFAAQAVFVSMLLSSLTLTIVVNIALNIF